MVLKGNFTSGFAAGAISSVISSSIQGLGKINKHLKDAITIASGGLSGGISSSIAGGNFWRGAKQGVITSGLNHVAHSVVNKKTVIDLDQRKEQGYDDLLFDNKKDAYNYAVDESKFVDENSDMARYLNKEITGFGLVNGDYVVLDSSRNSYKKSYTHNEIRTKDKLYFKYLGKKHLVSTHFHTHPPLKHTLGRIGVSRADLFALIKKYEPYNVNMSILYKGNEWLLNKGNQYNMGNYNYSLQNAGSW